MLRVGVDALSVERMATAVRRSGERFLSRSFTPDELAYCLHDAEPCGKASTPGVEREAKRGGGRILTFGPGGDETADKGVWMSIWVEDVDAVHQRCLEQGLEVTWPPTNMPWSVREMHVRHPDGHVFRISRGIEDEE